VGDRRAIKLMQNCICFSNPCVIILALRFVVREYHLSSGVQRGGEQGNGLGNLKQGAAKE